MLAHVGEAYPRRRTTTEMLKAIGQKLSCRLVQSEAIARWHRIYRPDNISLPALTGVWLLQLAADCKTGIYFN